MGYVSVLVDFGSTATNVDKRWVLDRIKGSISTILDAADMGTLQSLLFSYNMMVRRARARAGSRLEPRS